MNNRERKDKMRRPNGQFISNAEIMKLMAKLKTNHEQALQTIGSYEREYDKICENLKNSSKELTKHKDKLNTFNFMLRLTEIFLVPIVAVPFILLFIFGELQSALDVLYRLSIVYCLACLITSISIIFEYYNKNEGDS